MKIFRELKLINTILQSIYSQVRAWKLSKIKLASIFLICFVFLETINAKEQHLSNEVKERYSLHNIESHLYTIFKKEIFAKKDDDVGTYIPFSGYLNVYCDFSNSIKNQEEKIKTLEEVIKKFEKIVNIKIILKKGKQDITFIEQNEGIDIKYDSGKALLERSIYIDFLNKDEMISKLKNNLLYRKMALSNKTSDEKQAIINYLINYPRAISIDVRTFQNINLNDLDAKLTTKNNKSYNVELNIDVSVIKHFHFEEVNSYREEHFKEFATQIIYLSLLSSRTKFRNNSGYIKPSILNFKDDDFENGGGISEFDWILLDEFYNNKDLKSLMTYAEVIPILAKAIFLRIQKVNK